MIIINFVNFESSICMKLYNLLILNKIQNSKKNNIKSLKKTKNLYFQDVYCHVNKFVYSIPHIDRNYWPSQTAWSK